MLARRALLCCAVASTLAACGDARVTEKSTSNTGCSRCHGSADSPAPPVSALGASDPTDPGVGAHTQHLRSGFLRGPIACEECHVVPSSVEGHVDGRATVTFGPLATAGALSPSWDREAGTCAATWCHGGGLPAAGGTVTAPVWTAVAQGQTACGTCHGAPPPAPHPSNPACARCHPDTVRANGMVDGPGGHHLDGTLDVPALTCSACHGSDANAAPPTASTGAESTAAVEVGAHQSHVRTGAIRLALGCDDCHRVPTSMLHANGTVDLAWSALAGATTWSRGAATCATYCHGATLGAGGSNTLPVWTSVGTGQAACGTCHGAPPPPPHPANADCRRCHPDTIAPSGAIDVAGGRHVNGALEVTLTCSSCHGSEANPAPPISTTGESATTALAVGAHQAHVTTGAVRLALGCDACHVTPSALVHSNGTVDLAWSPLAGATTWDRGAATCATYCHGATLGAGGTNTLPIWTRVGTGQAACGTCHAAPPPAPHPANPDCHRCHPDTVTAAGTIDVAGGRHVDGTIDVGPLGCSSCHGSEANPAPPVSTRGESATTALAVGAHQAHVTTGTIRAALACNACHAVPTAMLHANGTVDLSWSALAGATTWSRDAATCSTYCHGATLGAGGTNTLPVWTSVGTGQTACGTCHGAPPPPPHPPASACDGCHRGTVTEGGAIDVAGGLHVDGTVELSGVACSSCHGSEANPAPPVSTTGESSTTAVAVGAHQPHVTGGTIRGPLACSDCHVTPSTLLHSNGTVDLRWSALAGATTWSRGAATCSTYCHGATLAAGGTNTLPVWTSVGTGQAACGTCHASPPPAPHPANADCHACHPDTVTAAGAIDLAAGRHVNGTVDVGPLGCSTCHGSAANPAPPVSTTGESSTTAIPVGAHQPHVTGGSIRGPLACSDCHAVPTTALHANGTVDLAWSALAGATTWSRDAATCSTYCHGATLDAGGTNRLPVWTSVGTGQAACGTCHATPPPAPHPANPDCSRCHPDTVTAAGAIDLDAGRHVNGTVDVGPLGCSACHGSDANPAPPVSTTGESSTAALAVGAHQAHLADGAVRRAVGCSSCHTVPTSLLHVDGTVELAFSALAGAVVWDRGAATCSTYCHGATLGAGGTNTVPVWTEVGTGQTACGTCHGAPPPAPHPANPDCNRCHPETVTEAGQIDLLLGRHIDGQVQVSGLGCSACHGSDANAAPPISTTGESATTAVAVGAHQAHVTTGAVRTALGCDACHAVPTTLLHADGTVDLSWSALAGATTWTRDAATCSTYCHGATLGAGGTNTLPVWTSVGTGQTACGTCHGAPPPAPHPPASACDGCHAGTVGEDGRILVSGGHHIDGTVQLDGAGCSACHGSAANPAPPVSTRGESETTAVAVGAHQAHVNDGALRRALACDDCHAMPTTALHSNGTVDLEWSALAGATTWDRASATCSTYCHGATLAGGTNTLPVWTEVGTGQAACGTCHGAPPPAPHPANPLCNGCHPETVDAQGLIDVAQGRHVDGEVEVSGSCSSCHGSEANPAPPLSTSGASATTDVSVGAHQAHVTDGPFRSALGCADCHVVPSTVAHSNGVVDLSWSALAGAVAWDRTAATCSTYCHGATLGGGTNTLPIWTLVGAGQAACGTCHGAPPPPPHPAQAACGGCHPDTVGEDGAILLAEGRHVNGTVDVSTTCGACHPVPGRSGAHAVHAAFDDPAVPAYGDLRILEGYDPAGGDSYRFGCGHCHPIDEARHMDGTLEVDLSPIAAGAAGLRALNAPDAAWAPDTGTCSGVYCHSSGQATPTYAATPAWTSTGQLGCGDCHGNPPAYASGGAATLDANSHLGLTDRGREFGHYAGMAGPSHVQKHGGGAWETPQGAAPITCQTCHFETTDPSTTGPSGFYWLDTRGTYALPGGDPARADDPAWRATQCGTCHGAGAAPPGLGGVRPLRHVNGRRDVVFDPRTALPPYASLPAAPNRPTLPYWVTNPRFCETLPAGAVLDGTTLSFHLAGAAWDPATKTCSGVACHLGDTPVWGRPYRSGLAAPDASCCGCHGTRCGR